MFRIKQTRNQTTEKQINLSPYPLGNKKFLIQKHTNQNIKKQNQVNISKNATKINNDLLIKKTETKPPIILKDKLATNKNVSKLSQIINTSALNKINLLNKKNEIKNPNLINKNSEKINLVSINKQAKPNSRLILRRLSNLPKENKINTNKTKQVIQNIQDNKNISVDKQNNLTQRDKIQKESKKQNVEGIIQIKKLNQIIPVQNLQTKNQKKQKREQKQQKILSNNSKKLQQQFQPQRKNKFIQQEISKKEQIKKEQIQYFKNDQNQKQKQMEEMMQKIKKRKQTRQKQKKRLQQIQQKQKQNMQKAQQFLAARNNSSQNGSIGGMIKLNDQLMHFSLAESIMDLQIKKLLNTNFDSFPNASQIRYQIQQLQRINASYQIIKYDQHNTLKNGLKNYRVQIFNRIGDLILKAQSQGYSNPNFHILQGDNNFRNPHLPQVIRGLPQENHSQFIKFQKIKQDQQCAICLGIIKQGQVSAQLQCKHIFHQNCIKDWILNSANCPTCRWNIKYGHKKNN